jgi:hypothetical protein
MFPPSFSWRRTAAPAGAAPWKLFCALVPVQAMPAGCVVETLLVRVRLGGGAAAGHLVTTHQEGGSLVCVRPTRREGSQGWRGRAENRPPRHADSFAPGYRPERPRRLRAGGRQRRATARRSAADRHAARCASRGLCAGVRPLGAIRPRAQALRKSEARVVRTAAWDAQAHPTFSDATALGRRSLCGGY